MTHVRETAKRANQALMNLITHDYDKKEDNNKRYRINVIQTLLHFTVKCEILWLFLLVLNKVKKVYEEVTIIDAHAKLLIVFCF